MTAMSFAVPWLAFALTWAMLAPVAVSVHAVVRRPLAGVEPAQRSALLLALALLPLAVAALVALLGFAPAIGGQLVNGHCHPHTGCHPHVPSLQASVVEAIWLSSLAALATGAVVLSLGRRLRRSVGLAHTLLGLASRIRGEELAVVESDAQFAYCIGLLRRRVVVSRGLLARLAPSEVEAVLAHERAHAARFDNLRLWLAALSLLPVPHAWRCALLRDLSAANDATCDARAADLTGPATVDAALASFDSASEHTAQRRGALATAPRDLSPTGVLALIVVVYAVCTLPALDATHYGAELVLRWLT